MINKLALEFDILDGFHFLLEKMSRVLSSETVNIVKPIF
jgi:hypothetical protein